MSNDRQVISYMSPADLVALMNQTGVIAVHESGTSDGKPVIHASVKVVNAQTGEHLPGGLPFSVVMFKGPNEPGYSNIAIGTIVPASELKVALPRDYFNFCNQRFRFTRTFPVDERSFVIQMDLVVHNATREYVKFSFGLWGALFSQMLFELMGRGRESLVTAAEAYAAARTDFAEQIASTPAMSAAAPAATSAEPMPLATEAIMPVEAALFDLDTEALALDRVEEPILEDAPAVEVADAVTPVEEPEAEEPNVEESKAEEVKVDAPELSIVAGPMAVEDIVVDIVTADEPTFIEQAADLAEAKLDAVAELVTGEAVAADVMPG